MLRRTTLSTGQQDTERPDRNSDCARKPRLSALRTVFAEFGRWLWKEYCAVCFARRTRPEISESLLDEKDKQNGYGHNRKASSWNDGWLWEILSGVFSVICLIAIFVVLAVYEKKSVPQMPYNITLNAVVSILATFAKSSLLLGISAAMSQYKWIWYSHQSRKMKDFQIFDDASRGPLGALNILISRTTRSSASLGALVILTALTVDPFVQMVLSYPLGTVIKQSDAVVASYIRNFGSGADSNPSMFDIRTALSVALTGTAPPPDVQCPSGNCTWPRFRSMAWCNKCTDVKDKIEFSGLDFNSTAICGDLPTAASSGDLIGNCSFTIPGGWSTFTSIGFKGSNGVDTCVVTVPKTLVWPLNYQIWDSFGYHPHMMNSTFDETPNPLITFGYVSLDFNATGLQGKEYIREARTCSLTPCVNTFNLSVTNGVSTMEILETDFGRLVVAKDFSIDNESERSDFHLQPYHPIGQIDHWYSTVIGEGDVMNSTWLSWFESLWQTPDLNISAEWQPLTYWANLFDTRTSYDDLGFWGESLSGVDVIVKVLSGNTSAQETYSKSATDGKTYTNISIPELEYSTEAMELFDNTSSFPDLMSNIAASLTVLYQKDSHLKVHGSEGRLENYVSVRWVWLILPTAFVILGNTFLICVIIETKRTKTRIWKSSSLAMVYHGYNGDSQDLARMEHVSAMEKHAKGLEVSFKRDEESGLLGWY